MPWLFHRWWFGLDGLVRMLSFICVLLVVEDTSRSSGQAEAFPHIPTGSKPLGSTLAGNGTPTGWRPSRLGDGTLDACNTDRKQLVNNCKRSPRL